MMNDKGEPIQQVKVDVRSEATNKLFEVRTYGKGGAVNPDPYYQENLVLGDLPAGLYKVSFRYADEDRDRQTWVEIFPGQVTYFKFDGKNGFSTERPSAPTLDFLPSTSTATPLP
jgi:hypothetical protein